MTELLTALLALAAGFAAGWLLALRRLAPLGERLHESERALADARARFEEKDKAIELQRRTAEELKKELETSFQALAGQALQRNSEQLITVAGQKFAPFDEQLKQLRKATEELEGKRERAYGTLQEQLSSLRTSTSELKSQSEKLATALRGSSQARGRWGEATLRRLVELAGMEQHCDFDEQTATAGGARPDLVVRLPGKGAIPVDAKVPLAAYLDAEAATEEETRRALLAQHAAALKTHVRELARRDYARELGGQVDFTVLFVPGEPFVAAGFRADPELFDWALAQRVLIASPVTLLALLRTVRMNWDHVAVEQNAREIRDGALKLVEAARVFYEHFERLGAGLGKSVEAYNKAARSYETRLLPRARGLAELGLSEAGRLSEIAPIGEAPRAPEAVDEAAS